MPTNWHDIGPVTRFPDPSITPCLIDRVRLAVTHLDGVFGAVSGICNHVGGPLGEGRLEGEFLVCPWHGWKYHCRQGTGEPGFETDRVPAYAIKVEGGHLWVDLASPTGRSKASHARHPLARPPRREPGRIRVAGIGTTGMDPTNPRFSTSDFLLRIALSHAGEAHDAETRLLELSRLRIRHCEGYYSKSAEACTWPCSITEMDPSDEMQEIYEAMVHWADVVLVATPIRWGAASSLFFKMAERLNCVQNQITIRNRVLIQRKTAAFIITGGQDNIQGVAGHLLTFFGELGFHTPQFPFVAHSRGWTAEDMERNIAQVRESGDLHNGTRELVDRAVSLARTLLDHPDQAISRGGRKANRLDVERIGGKKPAEQ